MRILNDEITSNIFKKSDDFRIKGVSLGMLSVSGLGDYKTILPYFEKYVPGDPTISLHFCRE